jgi:hypothetical protein
VKLASIFLMLLSSFGTVQSVVAEEAHKSAHEAEDKPFPNELRRTIEYILNCYGDNQENTNQLIPVNKIIEIDCKIEKLGMLFDYYGSLTIPKARRLIIQAVTELLQTVNSSNKLTPYLANCGALTPDNIIVRIRWRSSTCGFFYPPLGNIAFVSAMENKIVYDTLNSYSFTLNNLMTESFQEGLRLNKVY